MKLALVLLLLASLSVGVAANLSKDGTCPILTLIPFSTSRPPKPGDVNRWPATVLNHLGFSFAAAAQLAIDQFNARDSSVVPEMAELTQGCNVTIPSQTVVDSQFSDTAASHGILFGTAKQTGDDEDEEDSCMVQKRWCAVVGPSGDRAASQSSAITSMLKIPQLIHNTDDMLANRNPSAISSVLNMDAKAKAIASYLQDRDYLLVINNRLPLGRNLAESLADLQSTKQVLKGIITMEQKPGETASAKVRDAKSYGYKTILLAMDKPSELMDLAQALYGEDMLNDKEYVYILLEEAVSVDSVEEIFGYQQPGSPMDRLLSGALVITRADKFAMDARKEAPSDPFMKSWQSQNSSMVERVNEVVLTALEKSKKPGSDKPLFQATPTYFQDTVPASLSSYVFDSVMAIALGACIHEQDLQKEEGKPGADSESAKPQRLPPPGDERMLLDESIFPGPPDGAMREEEMKNPSNHPQASRPSVMNADSGGPMPLKGPQNEFQKSILKTHFTGASGTVRFSSQVVRYRDAEGIMIGAYNIRPTHVNEDGLRTYQSVLADYAFATDGELEWIQGPGGKFVYRDGTVFAPTLLREIAEENHLSPFVQAMGLTLFASAAALSVVAGGMVWYLHKEGPVLAGQPPFLYLLCLGALLMSTAIFTLSWDESFGWSASQLSVACVLTPWFFFVGHLLMFSAMFTKLWRLDQVLQFRRGKKVEAVQVIAPLLLLLLVAAVLLTVWTAVDPWVWERKLINESPAETYGKCTCDHFREFFYSLAALLVFGKLLTAAAAWKTADIPQDFSDASSVFYAISLHIQAWFIGIPILAVLGDDNANAVYFGRVLLIWIFAVSAVGLIIVPKLLAAYHLRRHPKERTSKRVRISGLNLDHYPRPSEGIDDTYRGCSGRYSNTSMDSSAKRLLLAASNGMQNSTKSSSSGTTISKHNPGVSSITSEGQQIFFRTSGTSTDMPLVDIPPTEEAGVNIDPGQLEPVLLDSAPTEKAGVNFAPVQPALPQATKETNEEMNESKGERMNPVQPEAAKETNEEMNESKDVSMIEPPNPEGDMLEDTPAREPDSACLLLSNHAEDRHGPCTTAANESGNVGV